MSYTQLHERLATGSAIVLPLAGTADYPGAVALLTASGEVAALGGGAAAIIDGLREIGAWPSLAEAAARAISEQAAIVEIIGPTGVAEPVEATLLPLAGGDEVLALIRPLTFESALRATLVESRQRYKDLVELTADFAWEVDRDGCFRFVSPGGALGWTARELVGRKVGEFLAGSDHDAAFAAERPVRDAEAWFRRPDGGSECLAISATPLRNSSGTWLGARGVCRVVTAERHRADEAAEGRLRDRLIVYLTRSIRDEIDPGAALASAISATGPAAQHDGP
jgi:PAS domain S-box-containing protein